MKRILAMLIIAMLVVCLFGGCGNSKQTDTSSTISTPAVTEDIFSTVDVVYLDSDGEAVYRIVRPDGDSSATAAATNVFKNMKTVLGVNFKNVLDGEDGTDMYEILVGNTNRPESQQALQYLRDNGQGRFNDYIVCTIGKKIVINGMSQEAVTAAAEYFIANYIKKEGVKGGMKSVYNMTGEFQNITVNGVSIGRFKFVRDYTNRSWLIQEEIRKTQELLKAKTGFALELTEDAETTEYEYEISVGNTNRSGVKSQSEYTRDEYEIKISGKKVYLLGGSTYAVQVAVTEFGKLLEKGTLTDADSKTGFYSQTVANYDSSSYYSVKWADEFDGNTLNDKWYIVEAKNGKSNGVTNEHTCEVSGGNLIMRGFPNDEGGYDHCNAIESTKFMRFNMGYLEMRARIPDGTGVYSSFWLRGKDINGQGETLEIDIFESLGNAHRQVATIHKWQSEANGGHVGLDAGQKRDYVLKEGTLFDEYRTVGMLWNGTEVRFFYDGTEYYSHPTDEFFVGKYLELLAGFNVGRENRTAPDSSIEWPLEYHIDYIRLYQIDGQGLIFK